VDDGTLLLDAVLDFPDEDTPRLAYADWLDEHGDPERAEFIRVQIDLSRIDCPECGGCGRTGHRRPIHRCGTCRGDFAEKFALLSAREDVLRRSVWVRPGRVNSLVFWKRGFGEGVTLSADAFMTRAEDLFCTHPIRAVSLYDKSPIEYRSHSSRGVFYPHGYVFIDRASLSRHESQPVYPHWLPHDLFARLEGYDDAVRTVPGVHRGYTTFQAAMDALQAAGLEHGLSARRRARRHRRRESASDV
jgi:uncharacterized protein (TIGR02996 family)